MEIQPKQPSTKGPAEMFTGDVWFDVIAKGEEPSRMRVNVVRFVPGARTAWHCHAVGQTLHVTEGRGLTQSRGGEGVEIRPGDTIYAPPGEWHWHGATPAHFMTHGHVGRPRRRPRPGIRVGRPRHRRGIQRFERTLTRGLDSMRTTTLGSPGPKVGVIGLGCMGMTLLL